MDILENKEQWQADYESGWLAHRKAHDRPNWKLYQHPKNEHAPGLPGIDLTAARLVLLSTAGGYLPATQDPFDAASPYGDYSIRRVPITTAPDAMAYAHDHYDHTHIDKDRESCLPLGHLADLVESGRIDSLAPDVISFMGYQPDSARFVDESVPLIIEAAKDMHADAALLAPV